MIATDQRIEAIGRRLQRVREAAARLRRELARALERDLKPDNTFGGNTSRSGGTSGRRRRS